MAEEKSNFEGWCILELMGHRRLGGYVRETTVAGAGFLRIDIPGGEGEAEWIASQIYAPSSVYCITPTTIEMAKAAAASSRPEPVSRWELKQLTQPDNPVRERIDPSVGDDDELPFDDGSEEGPL